jgi:hypothetical protein
MKHPECLLKTNKEDCDPIQFATFILEFYRSADMTLPDWIEFFVGVDVLDSNADDTRLQIRAFFINAINEAYQKYTRIMSSANTNSNQTLEQPSGLYQ